MNFGRVKVKVEGLNLLRLIDKLVASEVCLLNLKIKPYSFVCEIDETFFEKFKTVCKREKKEFKIVGGFSLKKLLGESRKMLGFLLAIIISSSYLFSFNKVVFKLDVSYLSSSSYDMTKVVKVLDENNVRQGAYLKMSAKEIESLLIKSVDDISGCRVIKDGSVLSICVYPEVKSAPSKVLISKFDAVITRQEIFSGNAKHKVGDVVKKGEILVESDEQSSGVIEGKVYFSAGEIYNENQQVVTFTGRKFYNRKFKIFQKTLINDTKTNIFSQYLTKKCVFSLNKNLFIPIVCEEEIVYEVEIKNKIIGFKEKETEIKTRLKEQLKEQVGEMFDENKITFSVVRDGSYVRVDCYAEIEMSLI